MAFKTIYEQTCYSYDSRDGIYAYWSGFPIDSIHIGDTVQYVMTRNSITSGLQTATISASTVSDYIYQITPGIVYGHGNNLYIHFASDGKVYASNGGMNSGALLSNTSFTMMIDSPVNKVEYFGETLIDISDTTATAEDVMSGKEFYAASGKKVTGTYVKPKVKIDSEFDTDDADVRVYYSGSTVRYITSVYDGSGGYTLHWYKLEDDFWDGDRVVYTNFDEFPYNVPASTAVGTYMWKIGYSYFNSGQIRARVVDTAKYMPLDGSVNQLELLAKKPVIGEESVVGYDGIWFVFTTKDSDNYDMSNVKVWYYTGGSGGSGGGSSVKVEATKAYGTVVPTSASQDITIIPSTGYDAMAKVTLTVASASTPTYDTPSINVSSAGLITATANGKSGTKQLTTKAATTITPTKSTQTAISSGTYATGDITVGAIPAEYIVPSGRARYIENGDYDVTELASVTVNVPTGGAKVQRGTATLNSGSSILTINHTLGKKPDFICVWNNETSTNTQRTHCIHYDSGLSSTVARYQYYRSGAYITKNVSTTKNSTSYVYMDETTITLPYYSSTYPFSGTYYYIIGTYS